MKVLIVGLGSVGKKHYNALCQLDPECKVVALRNSRDSVPADNIENIYSFEELKLSTPFDFAIISNPTYQHADTIKHLLELNCPLFIEKPLFHSINSDSILKSISSAGIKTYVACNLRFLDSIIFLKKMLPGIRVNEVNIYCGSFLPEWRPEVDYKTIYSSHSQKGGGVHLDLIHELDYTLWLFGKPLSVNSFRSSKSTLCINAVDYSNYMLEYNGFAVNVILNYYRRDKKRTIELVCQDDTYTVDLYSNSVSTAKELVFKSDQVINDTYIDQMEYFIDMITNPLKKNVGIMNNVNEAFEVLKICLDKWN